VSELDNAIQNSCVLIDVSLARGLDPRWCDAFVETRMETARRVSTNTRAGQFGDEKPGLGGSMALWEVVEEKNNKFGFLIERMKIR
jgi:hypothetical protein